MKKIPMRRCLATNESFPKNELLRIVRTPVGEVKVDLSGKLNGKGAYISKSMEALNLARKSKVLNKALEVEVADSVYEQIEEIING